MFGKERFDSPQSRRARGNEGDASGLPAGFHPTGGKLETVPAGVKPGGRDSLAPRDSENGFPAPESNVEGLVTAPFPSIEPDLLRGREGVGQVTL